MQRAVAHFSEQYLPFSFPRPVGDPPAARRLGRHRARPGRRRRARGRRRRSPGRRPARRRPARARTVTRLPRPGAAPVTGPARRARSAHRHSHRPEAAPDGRPVRPPRPSAAGTPRTTRTGPEPGRGGPTRAEQRQYARVRQADHASQGRAHAGPAAPARAPRPHRSVLRTPRRVAGQPRRAAAPVRRPTRTGPSLTQRRRPTAPTTRPAPPRRPRVPTPRSPTPPRCAPPGGDHRGRFGRRLLVMTQSPGA